MAQKINLTFKNKKATYFFGIWCQSGIPFLAPYSAKTEPVLALYGAKNGITFWHHMVFFGLQFLIIFWAIATYINTIHLQSIRKYQTNQEISLPRLFQNIINTSHMELKMENFLVWFQVCKSFVFQLIADIQKFLLVQYLNWYFLSFYLKKYLYLTSFISVDIRFNQMYVKKYTSYLVCQN